MHTDSGMTGISLSGYMPYMTVASLEMSDEPNIFFMSFYFLLLVIRKTTNLLVKKRAYLQQPSFLHIGWPRKSANIFFAVSQFSLLIQYFTFGVSISPWISPASFNSFRC